MHKLEEADSTITSLLKLDNASLPLMPTTILGMAADSYVLIVQAQVNMAFGRYAYQTLIIIASFPGCSGTVIDLIFLSAGLIQLVHWLRRLDLLIVETQRLKGS